MFFSCNKELDTTPQDFLPSDQYFKTESDLEAALAGVYASLAQDGTFGRYLPIELEMGNDEGHFNNRNNKHTVPSIYDCQSSTKIYSDCWTALYAGIGRANLLLENVDNAEVSDELKRNIKGEALFLRAFNYFQLVTRFGPVPLVLKANTVVGNTNNVRTSDIAIYEQILLDMKTADTLVKKVTEINCGTRVCQTVVEGIIARVYLKMAGNPLRLGIPAYDSARTYALKVINSGLHNLNPDYRQVFINHSQDKYDNVYRESMWEIEFIGNNTPQDAVPPGSRFASQLAQRYAGSDPDPMIIYGYGSYVPSGVLYEMYNNPFNPNNTNKENNDTIRRNWNMPEFTYCESCTPRSSSSCAGVKTYERDCGKWKRDYETYLPKQRDWGPTNFPILRYADVLLMASEAENEVNGPLNAVKYINQVRSRAKADTVRFATNQISFRNYLREERARELCFEGLRKFDLIRWGIFVDRMKLTGQKIIESDATSTHKNRFVEAYDNVSDRDTLLPIPSSEISVNPLMTQNPGW